MPFLGFCDARGKFVAETCKILSLIALLAHTIDLAGF